MGSYKGAVDTASRSDSISHIFEFLFQFSSTIRIGIRAWSISPFLAVLYVLLVVYLFETYRPRQTSMRGLVARPLVVLNGVVFTTILLNGFTSAQVVTSLSVTQMSQASPGPTQGSAGSGTATTSFRPIFTVPAAADVGATLVPNIYDSEAVNAQSVCPGYVGSDVQRTNLGLTATLSLAGDACNVYGTDIATLNLTVQYQSADRLNVKITPAYIDSSNSSMYLLADHLIHEPTADADAESTSLNNDLSFSWSNDPTFSFSVTRKSTGDMLFSTHGSKIVFENQFVEFSSPLPENYNLYGLGETIHSLRLGNNFTKTIYAADAGDPIDLNIYGSHPFYLDTRYYEVNPVTGNLTLVTSTNTSTDAEYTSYSHGLYNRNAHGQEVLLRPSNITWRALGGSIDLYFYAGPTQPQVTTAYQTSAIGLPAMQQYFTFGFHQCRWGYANWSQLQDVVDSYARFEIPLENIWTDIDYMNQYRDFDNDAVRFNYTEGTIFLDGIHANGLHYIPIVDSAIYVPNPNNASDAYAPFDRGNASGAFMTNPDGSLYIGEVWPGYTVFPDWLSPGAGNWWTGEVDTWYSDVKFDGIWIDMSEVSSFCVGSCGFGNVTMNPVHPGFTLPGEPGAIVYGYPEGFNITNATEAAAASSGAAAQASSLSAAAGPAPTTTPTFLRTTPTPGVRNINQPPYVINNVQGDLAVHAASPNATHADGTVEYDVHNLFGHQILNATYHALLKVMPSKRPFIIGRSTFAGSGVYAGHWGGDNFSQWLYMYFSIPQALSFSLFGIPMFGVDTCGFQGNSDEELCNRWMQLSAFFPFYRNHNGLNSISQEAYVWASVAEATKTAMNIRFKLLPYMYTLFYLSHTTGSTVMRALSWEFPDDPWIADADRQFFLGPAILVTPVLNQGATSVDGVFPGVGMAGGACYYDWYTQEQMSVSPGQNLTIDAPLGHIPVYIRGGNVIPMQDVAMTTRDARNTPWSLLVALSMEGTASGSLYLDDGESLTPNKTLYVQLSASSSTISAFGRGAYTDSNPLANITILGVKAAPSGTPTLNGMNITEGLAYNQTSQVLKITGLQSLTSKGAWTSDWTLTL
ncbi:hypothetical protein MMC25_003279 [Agyrium rufum]|nr:hypothetical protein [Agyrium rufum]